MKFETQGDFRMVLGTYLQGEMAISYESLVHLFGQPLEGDGYKTQAEWVIRFEDGTIATIYDWKLGACYVGEEEGIEPQEILSWHIGGKDRHAYDLVVEVCADHLIGAAAPLTL